MVDTVAPAVLNVGEKTYDLPTLTGTLGPDVVDVRHLYSEADIFTYDPSFSSTASCESKITFIDGDKGILLHRGYPIADLAKNSNFLEVAYLLLYGELPTASEFSEFEEVGVLGQVCDRIAAVQQNALVAIDEGDLALAARG